MKPVLISTILFLSFFLLGCEQSMKEEKPAKVKAKNIVLMIGDGMGISQITAGLTANKGHLNLEEFKDIGFSKTQSAS
ncbi:MAG: hypothetical protein R2750_13930 [Bacteroidales bacterium]